MLAALFFLPRAGLAALAALLVALGAHEWARLCRLGSVASAVYAAALLVVFAAAYVLDERVARGALLAASLFWVVIAPAWLSRGVGAQQRIALAASGLLVLVPSALALVLLRAEQVVQVLVLVWIADSAAYFVGRRWGRRPLAPSISPGKTWEGAWGGIAGAAAYAMIGATFLTGIARLPAYLVIAVVLAAISIVGDLFESAAKRQAEVKDSGTLLPGHGGILDRIDSATAALPVAALLLSYARP
jgi:phosphatidate cytidylyltransferase